MCTWGGDSALLFEYRRSGRTDNAFPTQTAVESMHAKKKIHRRAISTVGGNLTHAVVAQPHVVERYVVLADIFRAVPVEAKCVLVLADAIVKSANLESYVLKCGGTEHGGN